VYPVATLERICADAWPPIVTERIGEWRLRAAGGYTGRANSALAVGDPGMPITRALRRVRDFCHVHGIPPKVQAVQNSEVETDLAAAGWSPDRAHTAGTLVSVQTGPLTHGAPTDATVTPATLRPDPRWWELAVGSPTPSEAQRRVVTGDRSALDVAYCTVEAHGRTVGAARGAVIDDMLYLSNLAVRSTHRGHGLAERVLDTLGVWARTHGAEGSLLQVAVDNTAANRLYARRGCTESHRYRYWVPNTTCEDHTL